MLRAIASDGPEVLWDFSGGGPYRFPPGVEDVRINELIRKSVVFRGILDARGGFAPYGTAAIVGWPSDGIADATHHYLVTAKHVVDQMAVTGRPMVCRVNMRE